MLRERRLRTPLQRAVVPVVGGLGFFALLGLMLWGIAAVIAGSPSDVDQRLATTTFRVGDVESVAAIIAEDGPLIFPDLVRTGGTRTVVLDHTGADVRNGWWVYFAYPADRDVTCKVDQIETTRDFVDCDGRTVSAEHLAPAAGVSPVISDVVVIDLRKATTGTDPPPNSS